MMERQYVRKLLGSVFVSVLRQVGHVELELVLDEAWSVAAVVVVVVVVGN